MLILLLLFTAACSGTDTQPGDGGAASDIASEQDASAESVTAGDGTTSPGVASDVGPVTDTVSMDDAGSARMDASAESAALDPPPFDPSQPVGEPIGGCVQSTPREAAPSDPYQREAVTATTDYGPFTKKLEVYGIVLIGDDTISDAFMERVADVVVDMFPRDEVADTAAQASLLRNMHAYRAVIPLFYGEPNFDGPGSRAFDTVFDNNSVCDIIMQAVDGQVMEVLEHLLHIITDVGFVHTFDADWGIASDSALYVAMQEAVDAGIYDISMYSDIPEAGPRLRVEIQEYAYWLISTAWDLQSPYGPGPSSEWKILTPDELWAQNPSAKALYETQVAPLMAAPSRESLEALLPFRR